MWARLGKECWNPSFKAFYILQLLTALRFCRLRMHQLTDARIYASVRYDLKDIKCVMLNWERIEKNLNKA